MEGGDNYNAVEGENMEMTGGETTNTTTESTYTLGGITTTNTLPQYTTSRVLPPIINSTVKPPIISQ